MTAELALALPSVTLVLGLTLGLGTAAVTQLRVVAAAGLAAREIARGSSPASARSVVTSQAGADADLALATLSDGQIGVTVTRRLHLPLPGDPQVSASWRAVATPERTAFGDG